MEKQLLLDFINKGLSANKIAKENGCCLSTVQYWIKKHKLTEIKNNMYFKNTNCLICEKELSGKQTKFCCSQCKSKSVKPEYSTRKNIGLERKQKLIDLKGGKCCKCGYNKNSSALEFHHLNPSEKLFGIDIRKCSNSTWSNLISEVEKCILICSNCHRELHHPELTKL